MFNDTNYIKTNPYTNVSRVGNMILFQKNNLNSISIVAYLRDNPIRKKKKNGFLAAEFMISLRRVPEVK